MKKLGLKFNTVKEIYSYIRKTEGFRGLWKGFSISMAPYLIWNSGKIGFLSQLDIKEQIRKFDSGEVDNEYWWDCFTSKDFGISLLFCYFFASPIGVLRHKMAGDLGPTAVERQFPKVRDCIRYIMKNDGFWYGMWKGCWGSFYSTLIFTGCLGLYGLTTFGLVNYVHPYVGYGTAIITLPLISWATYFYLAVIPANLMVTAGDISSNPNYDKLRYYGLRCSYKEVSYRAMMKGFPVCLLLMLMNGTEKVLQNSDIY